MPVWVDVTVRNFLAGFPSSSLWHIGLQRSAIENGEKIYEATPSRISVSRFGLADVFGRATVHQV
jgi:hypothetical protein